MADDKVKEKKEKKKKEPGVYAVGSRTFSPNLKK